MSNKITYHVVVRSNQFDCDIIADCGHKHKSIGAARHCMDKLTRWQDGESSQRWYNARIETSAGERVDQ